MRVTVTVEAEDYDEAKYILGAAALSQSIDKYNRIVDTYASVPAAWVLARTVNLASTWLREAKSDDSDLASDDVLNVSEEMGIEYWAIAFAAMDRAKKIFLELVNSDDNYAERYQSFLSTMEE